jgi:glycosyltransferase involved in cell wall biosynthesis
VNAYLPPDYGGAELAGYEYGRRVRGGGGDVVLIGRRPGSGEGDHDRNLPAWVHPATLPRNGGPSGPARLVPTAVRSVARTARPLLRRMWELRDRFDVVHVFNSKPVFNLLAAPIGRMLGKRVVLEMSLVGSDDPLTLRSGGRSGETARRRPELRYLLFRCADAYVSKSPALSEAYREAGLAGGKLWEIPYGVDTERFAPPGDEERAAVRRGLGLPPDAVIALFVGGISPRKGVHWLVEAFGRIRERHEEMHLALVGPSDKYDPDFVARIRAAAREGVASGRITLVEGLAENVDEYMRAADVYVLPSTREGLPITVLEAMSTGLPVIGSDIPEISRTQVTPGENGLLVPVGDVDALASALSRLAGDAGLRRRMGRAARERAEVRFSTDAVDREYARLYSSLRP